MTEKLLTLLCVLLLSCALDEPPREHEGNDAVEDVGSQGGVEDALRDVAGTAEDDSELFAELAIEICATALSQDTTGEARQRSNADIAEATSDPVEQTELRSMVEDRCGDDIMSIGFSGSDPGSADPSIPVDEQRALLDDALNRDTDFRSAFIAVLEALGVESVDLVAYDVEDNTITVSMTSRYRAETNIVDEAWLLSRTVAELGFWDPEIAWMADLSPHFDLELSQLQWSCPADLMERMTQARASRAEWQTEC